VIQAAGAIARRAHALAATSAGVGSLRCTSATRQAHAARSRLRPQRNKVGRGGSDERSGVHPRARSTDVAQS
jgi:hypothetical protein